MKKITLVTVVFLAILVLYIGFVPSRGLSPDLISLPDFVKRNDGFTELPVVGDVTWVRHGSLGHVEIFGKLDLAEYLSANYPFFKSEDEWKLFLSKTETFSISWRNFEQPDVELLFYQAEPIHDYEQEFHCNLFVSDSGYFVAMIMQ